MALAIRKVTNSIQAKAKPEAQLGDSETKAVSLGGSVVARTPR